MSCGTAEGVRLTIFAVFSSRVIALRCCKPLQEPSKLIGNRDSNAGPCAKAEDNWKHAAKNWNGLSAFVHQSSLSGAATVLLIFSKFSCTHRTRSAKGRLLTLMKSSPSKFPQFAT